jgi:hypothetical protein
MKRSLLVLFLLGVLSLGFTFPAQAGTVTIGTGTSSGSYSLLFSAPGFIKKTLSVQVTDQNLTGQNVVLMGGDGEITLIDLNIVLNNFGALGDE